MVAHSAAGEAYNSVASMRVRRGEALTDEEFATDLSIVRTLVEQGLSELQEPMPAGVSQTSLAGASGETTPSLQHGDMVDSVILKALGGDRGWNTLSWWNTLQLQDLLASAALVVDIREEAYLPAQPTSAHPANVLPLQGATTWEWEARTSRAMSDAANLIAAAVRLREAVPFMGEEMAGPAVQILQALTAWQESLFGGIHAVHAETQTEAPQYRGMRRGKTWQPNWWGRTATVAPLGYQLKI